jgi:hypothetical protein
VRDPVRVDAVRPVGLAEPAEIRCDDAEAGLDERRHLVAPEARRVREAVEQQHRRPLALVEHRERHAVALDPSHGRIVGRGR